MSFDDALADRVRQLVSCTPGLSEKKMFGGLAFSATNHGFFILLNLAMGGAFPDAIAATKTPTGATVSGRTMQVDYVRVYHTAERVTAGVFRPRNGVMFLKNTNTTGYADIAINYGLGGDYPIAGDWDGDGIDSIGVYRCDKEGNGTFYLRNSNTVGYADVYFPFNPHRTLESRPTPCVQPVAGDWDGDGIDTIGIYDSMEITFYLRNSNMAGPADHAFRLGIPGDIGLAGDWNGDGKDTTGVFRPGDGVIYLKNINETGIADIAINYGIGGDRPLTGDWDNDGIDSIGVLRVRTSLVEAAETLGDALLKVRT